MRSLVLFLVLASLACANTASRGPVTARPAAPARSTDLAHAYDLLLDDKVLEVDQLTQRQLEANPRNAEALILAGVVHIYYLELEKAGKFLERAKQAAGPDDPWQHLRSGDLQMALGNFKVAEDEYRKSIALSPKLVLAHLNLAATLIQDQRVDEGKASIARAQALGISSREERITQTLAQFLLGDLPGTSELVAAYRKAHGDSSTVVFIEAMLALRASKFDESHKLLAQAAERGIQNPSLIFQVANLYLALNKVEEAYALLARGCKLFPRSNKLAEQFKLVQARRHSADQMLEITDGPFEIKYEKSTPKSLLDRVVRLCRKAYRALAARLNYNPPRIRLQIFDSTGFAAPAYYNNLTGEIIVSGRFFREATGSMDAFVDHAIHHELAHLFLWDRKRGSTRSVNCLWMDEGLAEYLAGGVKYLTELDISFKQLFSDGPLSMSDLIGNINILWHDNKKNVKAYVQSYFMVDYLMRRVPEAQALDKITQLLDRVAHDVPLERAIPEVYGFGYDTFLSGWQSHLKSEVPKYR